LSGFAAVFTSGGSATPPRALQQMLARLAVRGADHTDVRSAGLGATLGVARHEWERSSGIAGAAGVVLDGDVAVAADASLYYRGDLLGALRGAGVSPAGETPGHLIAAAYRAWGPALTDHLEGDWAFVVWDGAARRVVAARDFAGGRPLHYAMVDRTLVVASTVGAVLGYPGTAHEYNVTMLGSMAAGLFGAASESAYAAVSTVPAGHTLRWEWGGEPTLAPHWSAPSFAGEVRPALRFADAAVELRRLLVAAAGERLATEGGTSISLSGGWDSPAVFAAGQQVLRERGRSGDLLQPVSMSFPEGDSGREDQLIQQITAHWNVQPRWVDIREAPLFQTLAERAPVEDEPFIHPYSAFNSALARAARATGARVMFTGLGGDHLFHVELSYLADLLRAGRLGTLGRELRAQPERDAALFREFVVRPLLGAHAARVAGRLRGATPRRYLEPTLPDWIRPEFVERAGLRAREESLIARRAGEDAAAYEKRWMLTHPFFPRTIRAARELALEAGVEQRAPLYDARVIAFAATRPREERHQGRETKRLLRAAMAGLLPEQVLAPRAHKTGTMGDYFTHAIQVEFPKIASIVFQNPLLAEMGIVDAKRLWQAGARAERGLPEDNMAELLFTLEVELWLRAKASAPSSSSRTTAVGV
jgi:asparagine synthase (glutamine-hydrolysing)